MAMQARKAGFNIKDHEHEDVDLYAGKSVGWRLTNTEDPEERLEDACMFKAMHDEYGAELAVVKGRDLPDIPIFGRGQRFMEDHNPVSSWLPYWEDKAFLEFSSRSVEAVPFEDLEKAVAEHHKRDVGAFIKSTRQKQAIFRIPPGASVEKMIGDLAYSFIDGGPKLLVQPICEVNYEYRFLVVEREVVTSSPVQIGLTPLDTATLPKGALYRTPKSKDYHVEPFMAGLLAKLAARVAERMNYPHACIDCAFFNGQPGVIEYNPMQIGQMGLFASDVRALAKASRTLIAEYAPRGPQVESEPFRDDSEQNFDL